MRAAHARQIRAGINAARHARTVARTEPFAAKLMVRAWAAFASKLEYAAASREWKRGEA